MIAVVQRVRRASVSVDGECIGAIAKGLLVLLGVAKTDTEAEVRYMADKLVSLRIFNDEQGKMNLALPDVKGSMLVISQFTLFGDVRRGKRPSFTDAAQPELAETLYENFIERVQEMGIKTQCGSFGAMMDVELVNDGPVTIIVQSK